MCASRWDRPKDAVYVPPTTIPEASEGPRDEERVDFGRNKGKTMRQTWDTDRNYCEWVTIEVEQGRGSSPGFNRLALYTITKQRWLEHHETLLHQRAKQQQEQALAAAKREAARTTPVKPTVTVIHSDTDSMSDDSEWETPVPP